MDETALGPRRIGHEYFDAAERKHYTVLHIGPTAVTIRWQSGKLETRHTPWVHGRDLIARPADHAPLGREYSADGEHWHFATGVARELVRA